VTADCARDRPRPCSAPSRNDLADSSESHLPVLAIEARGLSKEYRIAGGARPTVRYGTPWWGRSPARAGPIARTRAGDLALRDVGFEIPVGRVVGLIGRNGSGKSTLLRVLARITEPTAGEATVRVGIGTLLEIGTGFHRELTGRGQRLLERRDSRDAAQRDPREVRRDVSFAELEQFVDTPVKRYLQRDVHAPGLQRGRSPRYRRSYWSTRCSPSEDAAFQRRLSRQDADVAGAGRTVVFVSHNMAAVQALCTHGLLLKAGHLVFDGRYRSGVPAISRMLRPSRRRQSTSPPTGDRATSTTPCGFGGCSSYQRRDSRWLAEDEPLEIGSAFS